MKLSIVKSLSQAVLICCSVTAATALAEECESQVDMADSLNFHKMHIECSDDAVILYDPKPSPEDKNGVKTYQRDPAAAAADAARGDGPVASAATVATGVAATAPKKGALDQDNAGVIFNIREPFTLTGGPHSAITGLFAQMTHYCPGGWSKLKEWAEPDQNGYYLHYQFRCAD
ncbi:MAG: hypothetical protein GYB33_18835 [Gammaproteobacteria bacterium]|uniref:hypothetical protein n=1 Tax=Pseudomaricurvus alcaniphilus TaxID=1166482 RepID=UPI00140E2448|nr:hypothetical protein [Pseudomaricurvus alcaniphilus]MBR9912401.1 hypothetical protein [Gammaproteobacteria bacterium]NHN36766.1 hypothetical protein [Pseudomaricurvus alcaniphilus]